MTCLSAFSEMSADRRREAGVYHADDLNNSKCEAAERQSTSAVRQIAALSVEPTKHHRRTDQNRADPKLLTLRCQADERAAPT